MGVFNGLIKGNNKKENQIHISERSWNVCSLFVGKNSPDNVGSRISPMLLPFALKKYLQFLLEESDFRLQSLLSGLGG